MSQTSKSEYNFSQLEKEEEMMNSAWNGKRVSKDLIKEMMFEPRLEKHQNLPLGEGEKRVRHTGRVTLS